MKVKVFETVLMFKVMMLKKMVKRGALMQRKKMRMDNVRDVMKLKREKVLLMLRVEQGIGTIVIKLLSLLLLFFLKLILLKKVMTLKKVLLLLMRTRMLKMCGFC
ncbi:MAG: hypothetical protein QWI73_05230 [Alphaproteobacteria bacterium]|nr:hypothetical protein [Alphaproteobacteria bacterium]